MSMIRHRIALRLLARAQSVGVKEELVGDLIEEISGGRSQLWVWRQLTALYGFAAIGYVRSNFRLTPPMIVLSLSALLLAFAAFGSAGGAIEAWLGFYYVAGTASLFAHMVLSSINASRPVVFTDR
jgi:hypothetical protein